MEKKAMKSEIRASIGSLGILGLKKIALPVAPTTLYLMIGEKCMYNCVYCPQARESKGSVEQLSRVVWPRVNWDDLKKSILTIPESVKRVCFQVVNSPGFYNNLIFFVDDLNKHIKENSLRLSISVSVRLTDNDRLIRLFNAGVERVGLPLDVVSLKHFSKTRGGDFGKNFDFILGSARKFPGRITTHLIVGMGETDMELYNTMKIFFDSGITVGLFSFTPVKGTKYEKTSSPPLSRYRKIQILRQLLSVRANFEPRFNENGSLEGINVSSKEKFDEQEISNDKELVRKILNDPATFITSGCPDCNRPYYNESPAGPIYNYPFKPDDSVLNNISETLIAYAGEKEIQFKS
jgi:biotin synthase-related radical SAM superfamily protein